MQRLSVFALMVSLLVSWPCNMARSASIEGLAVEGLAVEVINQSEPNLCAEKDNVTVSFASKEVKRFRIEAMHPVYLASGQRDDWEADWTACDMSADPVYAPSTPPRKVTIYEDTELRIIAYTFPTFWRPATATVRIGERVENNLHMLQVWLLGINGPEEVLVLYPQDGYWRPRPLMPPGLNTVSFGSSFLVGPIETKGRPFVGIDEIAFEPTSRTFRLTFERGGSAMVRIAGADTNLIVLDVAFDRPITQGPFAMLRSMYVTEFNNDVARIALHEKGARSWREDNIMKFDRAFAIDVWAGRLSPSQHNGTSPDIVFNSFSDGPVTERSKSEPPPVPSIEGGSATPVR
jgi:hypothetical protein